MYIYIILCFSLLIYILSLCLPFSCFTESLMNFELHDTGVRVHSRQLYFVCVCVCVCVLGAILGVPGVIYPVSLYGDLCFETISSLIYLYVCKFSMYVPLFFAKAIDVQVCYEFVDLYKECHYIV